MTSLVAGLIMSLVDLGSGETIEVGCRGFGKIACTDAAKEGIAAFLARRKPEFKK